MKNKGFTLIELLAVIVILALIALVTIPMINNVIEKAKKGALEDSVYGLKNAAELYYSTTGTSETIEFDCTEEGCISGDKKLPFKGTVNEGKVKLFSDGKISICIENDNYASSILAKDKKVTTTTGSCDYTKEEYAITELVSANEYKKVKEDYSKVKGALKEKTIISSISNSSDTIVNEIKSLDLNQGEAANKKAIVEGLKYSGLGITEDMSWEEIKEILLNEYPEIPSGTSYNFAYTGGIQEWVIPASGLYKLEVWGAGTPAVLTNVGGALGGYSSGYKFIEKGTILYVVVGGKGVVAANNTWATGGYNGGGSAYNWDNKPSSSGGGATHIATRTGLLSTLGGTIDKILLVAGGAGGSAAVNQYEFGFGGSGGGTNGSGGTKSSESKGAAAQGGTQTSGGTGINNGNGSFGQGGKGTEWSGGGGGGGYYGGGGANATGGGGGSGYIGGVPEITHSGEIYRPTTSNGVNAEHGYAVITYIAS